MTTHPPLPPPRDQARLDKHALLQRIAGRVRRLREARQLSLAGLARRAGLTPKFIGEIERAETDPSTVTLARLAEALGAEVGHLFQDADAPLPVLARRIDVLMEQYHALGRTIVRLHMDGLLEQHRRRGVPAQHR